MLRIYKQFFIITNIPWRNNSMIHISPLPTAPANASIIPEDNAALGNEITRLAGHINAAQHRFLTLLAATARRLCCVPPWSRYVEAHHVQHWCDGGVTKVNNLVLLCRHHHRLPHQEGYEIVRERG